MANKIAIIGLGQIGSSIGLALKASPNLPKLVGFDKDPAAVRAAEGFGAIDSFAGLNDVVKDAEIIFLCLPLSEIHETLRRIGPKMKDEAVLIETAPLKGALTPWIREFVPAGRHYLGIVPAVGTPALESPDGGFKGASADLFKRTVMMIVAAPNTPSEIEQLGINLARLLGAKPMLANLAESDGIMTTAHLLPQLTAAALLEACVSEPGWLEARKMAGRPFAGVTGGLAYYDDPASLEVAAMANQPTVVHALDVIVETLKGMRNEIERGDRTNLSERLKHSFDSRERWLDERGAAAWLGEGGDAAELPRVGEQVMQMLFGSRIVDRNKPRKAKRV